MFNLLPLQTDARVGDFALTRGVLLQTLQQKEQLLASCCQQTTHTLRICSLGLSHYPGSQEFPLLYLINLIDRYICILHGDAWSSDHGVKPPLCFAFCMEMHGVPIFSFSLDACCSIVMLAFFIRACVCMNGASCEPVIIVRVALFQTVCPLFQLVSTTQLM